MRPPDMGDPGGSSSSGPHADKKLQPEVILYTASGSRRRAHTSAERCALGALLRGYVRDVSRSNVHRCELKSLLAARGCAFSLPQLLVSGRLVGGGDEVRQMHQAGELRGLLDDAPRPYPAFVCEACRTVSSEPCTRSWLHNSPDKITEKIVFFDPTKDVSMGSRGRVTVMEAPFNVSLGAMRPLLKKLDMMLGPQGCKLTKGVNDRLHLLKHDLEEICTYHEELLEVEDPPLAAKCWIKEAHELSYDILDYMDNLVPLELPGCRSVRNMSLVKIPKRFKWQKQIEYVAPHVSEHVISKTIRIDVIPVPRRFKWYQQMLEMISEFRTYAQEVIGRYKRYHVHCCSTSTARRFPPVGPMMPMPPPPCEKTCYGLVIDGPMREFINFQMANGGDQQLKVVSIHGSGCLGKTMLAKVLYNKIGRQFDCRAFIRVSQKPDMKRLFRDMLSQIQRKQPQASQDASDELCVTADDIRNYLHGKRYIIVVDDIWDTSTWDIINQVFPKGSQGSRILTTTQIEDVALASCCDHLENVLEIKPLDDDHSRKLFLNRLFGSESNCPEEFKQVSSQIVEICGGLPLAIIGIASLLANQQAAVSMDLLTHTHDLLISYLSYNSTSERTRQVLNLCYDSLPHYLKTCLLYLSMYPEGSIILKYDLVKQWMAERFIAATEGKTMEEVAGMYFDELVDRRFIQPMSINFSNEVVSCTVHEVVHDIIAHKSAEENFVVVVDYNRKILALSHKVHRLSLQLGDAKYARIPSNIRKSQVRSLGFFGLVECMPCVGEFKLLRVLNLQLSGHCHGSQDLAIDLTGISELFHLIYLKIACDVCIKLPRRMRGLQCLETLDMMDTTRGTHVPWDIIYLPHLLHLSLPPDSNLMDCAVSIGKLGMLNHLQNLYISAPRSSDHVERSVEDERRTMQALGSLIERHDSLKIIKVVAHGSSVRYGGTSKATIIDWYNVTPPPQLQRVEFSPHSGIIFDSIQRWVELFGNLCILKIVVTKLSISDVEILRVLPALTALSLYVESAPYQKIIFDKAGFSALKYFKLKCMSGIAWLKFEADAMPNLWKLKLVFSVIPQMDRRLFLYSEKPELKQYRHGNALISIEHMTGLGEISAKFGGATADLEYISRIGIVVNNPCNPIIDVQLVDSGSCGDKRILNSGDKDDQNATLEPSGHPLDGVGGKPHVISWSNIIGVIGRDLFIYCLHRLSRSDYGSIASLNHEFNSLVRNGDIYRLRRRNGVAEYWIYFSFNLLDWHAYDLHSGRWIQVPKLPKFQCFMIYNKELLAVGTQLLVLGKENTIVAYSILTNSWTWQANGMNTPRWLFGSTSIGAKAYVFGGLDTSIELSSVEMYDSETYTWTILPSMNRARKKCSGVFLDGKFYVVGGSCDNQLLTCGEEYELEGGSNSWRVIENMSEGLSTEVVGAPPLIAVVNNELYAADYTDNVLKQYDKLDNKWIILAMLPVQSASTMKGWDIGFRGCGDRLIVIGPPINSTDDQVVELHSWIPGEQLPVWRFVATQPIQSFVQHFYTVMGC